MLTNHNRSWMDEETPQRRGLGWAFWGFVSMISLAAIIAALCASVGCQTANPNWVGAGEWRHADGTVTEIGH